MLMPVIMFGYPPIPTAPPTLVASPGQVMGIIDPYLGSSQPLFVLSPMPRGGFSGGPVLTDSGWLLGVVTSSLLTDGNPAELGFGVAITVEPIWELLAENGVFPASNGPMLADLFHLPIPE